MTIGFASAWAGAGFTSSATTVGGTTQASGSAFLVGVAAGGGSGNVSSVTDSFGNTYTLQPVSPGNIGFGAAYLYLYAAVPGTVPVLPGSKNCYPGSC